jgi:uncharacterized phage protein (TIGR02216 family)
MKSDTIPWDEMMKYALSVLNVTPNNFWNLTMLEFVTLIKRTETKAKSITKKELEELIAKFG